MDNVVLGENGKEKRYCPICGDYFNEVKAINICLTPHYQEQQFTPAELITEDDDYAWVY